jgi:hypothetical protein
MAVFPFMRSITGGEGSVGETDPWFPVDGGNVNQGTSREGKGGAISGCAADSVDFCGEVEVHSEATSGWTRRYARVYLCWSYKFFRLSLLFVTSALKTVGAIVVDIE